MRYSIIEDCSPYYIRFTFAGLDKIINFVKELKFNYEKDIGGYIHQILNFDDAFSVIHSLPMSKEINFDVGRVAVFNTLPGRRSGIHKDGKVDRVGLNIPLNVLDDQCITTWYSDDSFNDKTLGPSFYTRLIANSSEDHSKYLKLKQMTAKNNEMILFNTDIYHSWDNTTSLNYRSVLTLRMSNPVNFYFNDARKILFGY